MKMLVITPAFPYWSQTFVIREIASLVRAGHEVVILAPTTGDDRGQELASKLDIPFENIIYLDIQNSPIFSFDFLRVSRARDLVIASQRDVYGILLSEKRKTFFATLLRNSMLNGVDLIHAHFVEWGYKVAKPLSGLLKVPYTITAHDGHLPNYPDNILRELQNTASKVILVSKTWKDVWQSKTGSSEKLEIVYNGIDLTEFPVEKPERRDVPCYRIITISRLVPFKRVADGVRAVSELNKAGFNCVYEVIGDGEQKETLAGLANELNISDSVILHGTLQHAELREKLLHADIYLHTSERESFGIAIAEAMASFLPVVAARSTGASEIVEDKATGYLYDVGNVNQITNYLSSLINEPETRHKFSMAGRKRIESVFSWSERMSKMEALWDGVLRGDR